MTADHLPLVVRAVARALSDVVIPAVDPDNELAVEQVAIVRRHLELLDRRLSLLHEREWYEHSHYLQLLEGLAEMVRAPGSSLADTPELARAVDAAIATGRWVRKAGGHDTDELKRSSEELTARASAVVRAAAHADGIDEATRTAVERLVIDRSADFVDLERAWFAPQGWTADVADDDALVRRLRSAD